MKRIVRRGVSLGFQTYEDTLEFEYDETQQGADQYVENVVSDFENEVLEKGLEWYNKIKVTDEYKEQQKSKQGKSDFKSSAKQQSGGYGNKGSYNKGGYQQKQQQSGGGNDTHISHLDGRELKLNGSNEANELVKTKGFGNGAQWDLALKKNANVSQINDYRGLMSTLNN